MENLTDMRVLNVGQEEACFVQFYGWYEDHISIYIAMEYLELSDLQRCVSSALSETESRNITFQVAEALKFMHEGEFTHRDLKPSVSIDVDLMEKHN